MLSQKTNHIGGNMETKPSNKIRRQLQHIQRKRSKDVTSRATRFARKKEEAKNPKLKAERLKRNVPLTLDRKREWDDVPSDVEDGLGLSFDVERVKRRRTEEQAQREKHEGKKQPANIEEDGESQPHGDRESEDYNDLDSMLASDSDSEPPSESDKKAEPPKRTSIRSASERATSPTNSSRITNLDLVPDSLASKFPSLFSSTPPLPPKILITTSINSVLHDQAQLLTSLFPNSVYIRRTAHAHAFKYSIREIAKFASNRNFTALVVLEEWSKKPSGLVVVNLPVGPTFHFTIRNWVEGKKLVGHGTPTDHGPELILNNFRTPLGLLTAHMFRTLFPIMPQLEGRQVVTMHNQRDYIFVRRHRYVFREKRDTEKSVVGADGEVMKGAEGIRAGLQELGPRFTLKLRRIDKGIQRASGQEWEWKGAMEKKRTRFQM